MDLTPSQIGMFESVDADTGEIGGGEVTLKKSVVFWVTRALMRIAFFVLFIPGLFVGLCMFLLAGADPEAPVSWLLRACKMEDLT